jgi:hypothetical protein
MLKTPVFCVALAAGLSGGAALAQQTESIKRTELQRIDYPGDKMVDRNRAELSCSKKHSSWCRGRLRA